MILFKIVSKLSITNHLNPFAQKAIVKQNNKSEDINENNIAVVYVRVSTESQDINKSSIECQKYCEDKGYKVKKIFEVIASTRLPPHKRRLDELFEIIEVGDIIVTTELTRLGRNVEENRVIMMELHRRGISVEFTRASNQILNTKSKLSGLLFEILSLFAEIERDYISERTKAGLEIAKQKAIAEGRKINIGRPKGTRFKSLMDRRDEVLHFVNIGVPVKRIADRLNVNRKTIANFIKYCATNKNNL